MKQVVLRNYARGTPKPEDYALVEAARPEPGEGEVLFKTLWLACDPLIRFSIDEELVSGVTHIKLGEPMYGPAVSQVVRSNHPGYTPGDIVEHCTHWAEYTLSAPDRADYRGPPRKLDPSRAPVQTALGALGMPGQTAHVGMIATGRVAAGETVVISAAAGTVGSLAGQIGKIFGAQVVGIAGGADKCAALLDLGFDAAVDYKAPDFAERLGAASPEGFDLYFDNVGGDISLAVMAQMKRGGRMAMCGFIAYHGMGMEGPGPDRLPGFYRLINSKALEIKGFASMGAGQQPIDDIAGWIGEGKIRVPEAVVEGIEAAPVAFSSVFGGNNFVGKLLVKVSEAL
ncbi:MAG: NADP-dependent oxidoreductase [Novosphingobium sp.]